MATAKEPIIQIIVGVSETQPTPMEGQEFAVRAEQPEHDGRRSPSEDSGIVETRVLHGSTRKRPELAVMQFREQEPGGVS